MFRSAKTRESDLAHRRFTAAMDHWKRTADQWFDGTVASVDERLAKLDKVLLFARDTAARLGSTGAGFLCSSALPNLEQSHRELKALRTDLLNGFSDRQAGSSPAGRRTAKTAAGGWAHWQDPHPSASGLGSSPSTHPQHGEYDRRQYPLDPNSQQRSGPGQNGMPVVPMASPHATPYNTGQAHPWDQGAHDPINVGPSGGGLPPTIARAVELGSRDFLASQNTTDRDELMIRARHYADVETSTLPVPVARELTGAFLGRIAALINAGQGPRQRTASRVVAHKDFDAELMFI